MPCPAVGRTPSQNLKKRARSESCVGKAKALKIGQRKKRLAQSRRRNSRSKKFQGQTKGKSNAKGKHEDAQGRGADACLSKDAAAKLSPPGNKGRAAKTGFPKKNKKGKGGKAIWEKHQGREKRNLASQIAW